MVKYEFSIMLDGTCTALDGSAVAMPNRSAPAHR